MLFSICHVRFIAITFTSLSKFPKEYVHVIACVMFLILTYRISNERFEYALFSFLEQIISVSGDCPNHCVSRLLNTLIIVTEIDVTMLKVLFLWQLYIVII